MSFAVSDLRFCLNSIQVAFKGALAFMLIDMQFDAP
jgi:hypothetical protein